MGLTPGVDCGFVTTIPTDTPQGCVELTGRGRVMFAKFIAPEWADSISHFGVFVHCEEVSRTVRAAIYDHNHATNRPNNKLLNDAVWTAQVGDNYLSFGPVDPVVTGGEPYWVGIYFGGQVDYTSWALRDAGHANAAIVQDGQYTNILSLPSTVGSLYNPITYESQALAAFIKFDYSQWRADPLPTPSYQNAVADPSVPFHWLLSIEGPSGVLARYASQDLVADARHFSAGLEVVNTPHGGIDPYTSACTSETAAIKLNPVPDGHADQPGTLRPHDLDRARRMSFAGMRAVLYRWAAGSPLSDPANVMLDGFLETPTMDANGALTMQLVSRVARYNRKFPRYLLDAQYFPDAHEDDRSAGIGVLMGNYLRVPVPCYDTAANRLAISEGVVTVTTLYRDDVAESKTVGQETDERGCTFTYADVSAAVEDSRFTASGTGLLDTEGRYTGTVNALISHPVDQVHALAHLFGGWAAEKINVGSFATLRSERKGLVGQVQVSSEDMTDLGRVMQDVGRILRAAFYDERGVLTARSIDLARAPAMRLRYGAGLISVESVDWVATPDRPTRITAKYRWGWNKKKKLMDFLASRELNSANNALFAANLAANEGSESELDKLETKMIADDDTMARALDWHAELAGVDRMVCRAVVGREGHLLRRLDVILLDWPDGPSADGLGWVGKPWLVKEIDGDLNTNSLVLLEV